MKNTISIQNSFVYAMFGRSYDNSTKNGGVHLINSIYNHPSLFNFAKLGNLLTS